MAFVELDRVGRRFGDVDALRDVSLSIEKGEWIAVMGPSGSGKTTLVNLLAGLDRPTSGRVRIEGKDLGAMEDAERVVFRRERIGIIFQHYHLVPYLTALENVMLAQYFHSLADRDEAREALRLVGLEERVGHRPGQLSGGEQQRVCIARALINHPKLILADEPTGSLDRENQERVLEILRKIHDRGVTIVTVTHDFTVGRLAGRRVELRHGELQAMAELPREIEEMFDEVLQQLWEATEERGRDCSDMPPLLHRRDLLAAMLGNGLVEESDGGYRMTEAGHRRARNVVRRHRLAENLLRDRLSVEDARIESNACVFEHAISPEVEEAICRALGHPRACPHGRPIPPGACCRA